MEGKIDMNIFKTFLVFCILISSYTFAQDKMPHKFNQAKEEGSFFANTMTPPVPFSINTINPVGTVPNLITFADYVTNGNTLKKVAVYGDTVIVMADYLDSNFTNLNERRIRYNFSLNGGATWSSTILVVSTVSNMAYSDLNSVLSIGARTLTASGRQYDGGSRGFAGLELLLGIGSFSTAEVPAPGRDYFTYKLSGTDLAGAYLSSTQDTLYFIKYNYVTNIFGTKQTIATSPNVGSTARHVVTASSSGQNVFVVWNTADSYVGAESTNGGTSFGSIISILPAGSSINGDSVAIWVCMDAVYKPGTTTKNAVFVTVPPGTSRRGYKIFSWSPGINGGNPVVIADYTTPNIPILNDSTFFEADLAQLHTNMVYVSNPSLAYTDNGTRLICTFCVAQKDTSSYGFHYFDIYSSYSDNDGATWSAPVNLTNTPNLDEIYVSISKTGNTSGAENLAFMVSECPGSNSFTQTSTPRCPNYWVYRKYNPVTGSLIGVSTISSNVPEGYSLHQNYPNPFNPSTKINFDMPKNGNVTLKVYDITGKLVSTVINNEFVSAGTKQVEFNAANLASGVYYYTLETNNWKDTKKMVLVK
jgi:hypothetical protein